MIPHQSSPVGTDHRDSRVLGTADCLDRMRSTPVGRLAFMTAGAPTVLPVNHGVLGSAVVFRTTSGAKLESAVRGAPVAFEADDWDADTRTGWSVVVSGVLEEVEDDGQVAQCEALGISSWAHPGADAVWLRVRPQEISGRLVGTHVLPGSA